ncbi:MAG: hypothetical protein EHM19_00655 [Candidatus Latescibacterota bacterium]|nr:MAG: hypothetical protein EHM19_00655 [Candidatus Latescibacterota bacterium]
MEEGQGEDRVEGRAELRAEGRRAGVWAGRLAGRSLASIEASVLGLLALAGRLAHLDHAPYVDELNHVLAARSLLENGTMRIGGGEAVYERAALFTRLVAELFRVFGEGLVVARIPAVIAGTALVVLLFLWVRSFAGRAAAWIAGLLLAFSPGAIYLSQQSRFYTMHAVFFLAGTIAVLALVRGPRGGARTAALAALAAGLFAAAAHLQVLTVVGVGGIGLWLLLAAAPRAKDRLKAARSSLRFVLPLVLAALLLLAFLAERDAIAACWRFFQRYDLWAAADRGNVRYYHWLFLEQYPTLWTLFPVLAVLALRARRREIGFSLLLFATAFAAQSLAAWKSERYLFYAMPFFFAVAGVGVAEAVPWLRSSAESLFRAPPIRATAALARLLAGTTLAFALVFALAGNGAFSMSARMLSGGDGDWPFARRYRGEADWKAAAEMFRPSLGEEAVVGSSDLKTLYYFGRVDYCLSLDLLDGPRGRLPEFTPHWKTGAVLISHAESLEKVMEARPTGLVLLETQQIGASWGVPRPVIELLERRATEIPLPKSWRLRAFRWGGSPPSS